MEDEYGDDGLTDEEREIEGKEYLERARNRAMKYLANKYGNTEK